jgi:hypothetical protein
MSEKLPEKVPTDKERFIQFRLDEVVPSNLPILTDTIPTEELMGERNENTPKENRVQFFEVMMRAKEKFGVSERVEQLQAFLRNRLDDLNTKAQETGALEKYFRILGEKYNKAGWKTKLAVGVSLGVGSGVALSTAAMPAAIACLSGIAVQRVAGLSSVFLKYEKEMQGEKWGKVQAMGKAMRNATLMTGGMLLLVEGVKEGVDYAKQQGWGDVAHEWLKQHWPFIEHQQSGHAAAPPAHPAGAPGIGHSTVTAPEAVPSVNETSTPKVFAEKIPDPTSIKVPARKGFGAESMMKQLWRELQEKHIALPAHANPDSDLARLLAADEKSIDKLIHQIASDDHHRFVHDGASVRVDADAQMSIGTHGELHLESPRYDYQVVPTHAPTTPEVQLASDNLYSSGQSGLQSTSDLNDVYAPGESIPPQTQTPVETPMAEVITNTSGLEIPTSEPHIYADATGKELFVYGGTPQEQTDVVLKYLNKNPKGTIFSADPSGNYRIPWYLTKEGVTSGPPMRAAGFLGFLSGLIKAPSPEDFKTNIT